MARDKRGHGSDPRITAGSIRFINALFANPEASIAEIAKAAQLSERACYYALQRPVVRQEIDKRIRERLGSLGYVRAAERIMRLVDGATSEYVQADVSKYVLGACGVKPGADVATARGEGLSLTVVLGGENITYSGTEPAGRMIEGMGQAPMLEANWFPGGLSGRSESK